MIIEKKLIKKNKLTEAIVLAGGMGMRLRGVIQDIPKPMSPINGIPFLVYVLRYLKKQSIQRVILAVGYKRELIQDYFGETYEGMDIVYVYEEVLLGTGGGIQQAIYQAKTENVAIVNGDTFFEADLLEMYAQHKKFNANLSIAVRKMYDFDRYGTVDFNTQNEVFAFVEKQKAKEGYINGGIYILNKAYFLSKNLPKKFSFEKDFMERFVGTDNSRFMVKSFSELTYFIDIGIPEDYQRAQIELPGKEKNGNEFKVVIFDLGNVTFYIDFQKSFQYWSEVSGLPVEKFQNIDYKHHRAITYERGLMPTDKMVEFINEQSGANLNIDEFHNGWNIIYGEPLPGIKDLILSLKTKNYKVVALSNTNISHQSVWIKQFKELVSLYDKIYCSHELHLAKPDPAIYLAVLNDLSITVKEAIFLDDNQDNVIAAQNLGIHTIWVQKVEDIFTGLRALDIIS